MSELGAMSWPQVEGARGAVLLVPLGATEQHGPHLPLSTDTEIAVALAREAARRIGGAVVAPPLPYGSSGEHQGFAGTLSIGQEAAELALIELCRSAAASFERIALVCAHGGNAVPVGRAVGRLREEGREIVAWSPSWDGDAHAGEVETSLMLAIAPQLVRLERAEPGNEEPIEQLLPRLVSGGVGAVSPNGVLGDPRGASAARGRELLAAAADALLAALQPATAQRCELCRDSTHNSHRSKVGAP